MSCDENEYVRKIVHAVLKTDDGHVLRKTSKDWLCKRSPLPGSMRAVQIENKEILLVNLDNKIYEINNTCTHRGCRLSDGNLEQETVQCPCHGSLFNIKTGDVEKGPAKTLEPAHKVTVKNGEITLAF